MPKINDIKENREKKGFKKRDYRPWDLEGNKTEVDKKPSLAPFPHDNLYDTVIEQDKILEIFPYEIKNWEFHDRPFNELGDIESLANEFKEIGQQQPCIVRLLSDNSEYKYELIVGERRWRAAQMAGLKLKIITKTLSDSEAAIIQASENSSRKDLSDYARGISYHSLIERGVITQKELTDKLKLSKQQISRLLSFSKIPEEIINKIQDMSKISARTAEQIKQLSNKGEEYINAIIKYADKLRLGEIGQEKLKELVEKSLNQNTRSYGGNEKVYSKNGRHLFTWRQDNNSCPSIHFPKDISDLLQKNKISLNQLTDVLSKIMEDKLMDIK